MTLDFPTLFLAIKPIPFPPIFFLVSFRLQEKVNKKSAHLWVISCWLRPIRVIANPWICSTEQKQGALHQLFKTDYLDQWFQNVSHFCPFNIILSFFCVCGTLEIPLILYGVHRILTIFVDPFFPLVVKETPIVYPLNIPLYVFQDSEFGWN